MTFDPFIRRVAQTHREQNIGDRVLPFDTFQPIPALVEIVPCPFAGHLDHAVTQALAHFAGLRFSVGANQPTTILGSGIDAGGGIMRHLGWHGRHRLDQIEQLHRVAPAVAVGIVIDKGPALPMGKVGVAVDLDTRAV
ncbi:hypothetical protein WS93_18160 [Burkholderia cepacia]|nr:hypothetical protein WS93_18160 [Burkholderia cepacia]